MPGHFIPSSGYGTPPRRGMFRPQLSKAKLERIASGAVCDSVRCGVAFHVCASGSQGRVERR
ncbi:hypothetical protein BOSEA31B_13871 [Hyphomicrobiales bacterium]|nr:hypothetical protein BOSEA31B_13871 [Hyphomicrobiales bacterium]CAH1699646.1 hypothetical protein BOSEA1005_12699 [Hyphomicrobiales bacterium]CAI0343381.1 hypothetical protein BO1005MUT1_240025 [Hyphomicrobiales bacterium]